MKIGLGTSVLVGVWLLVHVPAVSAMQKLLPCPEDWTLADLCLTDHDEIQDLTRAIRNEIERLREVGRDLAQQHPADNPVVSVGLVAILHNTQEKLAYDTSEEHAHLQRLHKLPISLTYTCWKETGIRTVWYHNLVRCNEHKDHLRSERAANVGWRPYCRSTTNDPPSLASMSDDGLRASSMPPSESGSDYLPNEQSDDDGAHLILRNK